MIAPGGNLDIRFYLDKGGSLVELPPDALVELTISSVTSETGPVGTANYGDYVYISSSNATYTNE
jgi:hypothetical protein